MQAAEQAHAEGAAAAADQGERTIFDQIVAGDIPCDKVYEDDTVLAFRDVNPVAPVHILVIPKDRQGLTMLSKSTAQHEALLGHLMHVAGRIGQEQCGDHGFRLVVNNGREAGQSVFHLHLHVIGGRPLTWPPG